jgi:hypothetical protein
MDVITMILAGLVLAGLVLAGLVLAGVAFAVLVAGIQATERRQSLQDPSRDGQAARFARWVLGARACQFPPAGDCQRGSAQRERVRA